MRTTKFTARLLLLLAVIGLLASPLFWAGSRHTPGTVALPAVSAQGYSGAMPNVTAAAGTSLRAPYTAGTIVQGGAQQAITADSTGLLTTANQSSCAAPAYTACNFVYWASGTSLSTTTTASTAFAVGNVVVAYITTNANDILVITPAAWSPSSAAYNTTRPSGAQTGGSYWVPPGNCWYSVATGTLTSPTFGATPGVTSLGLNWFSGVPVMQVATTNAAVVSTNTLTCMINPPSYVGVTGRGITLTDAVMYYGVQQAGGIAATQVAVLASGTMNGTIVFGKVAMPASGAGETASTVTPVRADSGTLTINPVVGSWNSAVTTAGAFYSATFTPATPFALQTDLTEYLVSVAFLCNTTQATTINTAGIQIHYTN